MNMTGTPGSTLGLIGGMSWHSTITYYRIINEFVAASRGGHASADLVLRSLDFAEVRDCQITENWDRAGAMLARAGLDCVAGGADVVAICTNLMHKVAPAVEEALEVPLIHIGDAVATRAKERGWTRLALLGTKWTMEETFYSERLARHGVEVVTPAEVDRAVVDEIIWAELTRGIVTDESRVVYQRIIDTLANQGAEAVVLGCTEIGLLIEASDSSLPIIDSAEAHALELANLAVSRDARVAVAL